MKKILILFIASLPFLGCKKFDNINVSPTALAEPTTRGLFTNVMQNINGTVAGANSSNMYVQYLSEGPYPGGSLYSTLNFDFSAFYNGPLFDLQKIIEYNGDPATAETFAAPVLNGSSNNQVGLARILKAYFFWWLTDRYGPIPYSQALQGNAEFSPVYDSQESIYTDLFKEFKEGAAMLNSGEKGVAGDIILDGDMDMWKKFAATCRMMMSLRLSKVNPAAGATEFNAAVADGVIGDGEDIIYQYISGDPNNYNPWYVNYSVSNRNDYAISTTMTDYMGPKNDPRLPVYAETLAGGVVAGLPYGENQAKNIPGIYSRIGDDFRSAGSPAPIFTYAQVLFSLAEAAKIGFIGGGDATAGTYYYDAIAASWDYYGVFDQATFDTYITEPGVAYTPATGYESIMVEKWVHLYLNGYESWADWRRTGFPVLTAAEGDVTGKGIPIRQAYPTTEGTLNKENYQAALQSLGYPGTATRDDNNRPVWWDVP